jgi:hypothetical protein
VFAMATVCEWKRNHKMLNVLSIDHSETPILDDGSDGKVR